MPHFLCLLLVYRCVCIFAFSEFPSTITVTVGAHDKFRDTRYTRDYTILSMYLHPDYVIRQFDNDIALLETIISIDFNDGVQPICLPGQGQQWPDWEPMVVTGWGSLNGKGRTTV